jgi:hypothetical protein
VIRVGEFHSDRLGRRDRVVGAVLALAAGLHKLLMASVLVNDDFMHQTYSRQLLAGEWPIRDFFDYGMGLMYVLGAGAQWMFGYRLLSEALLVGVATATATYLVYSVARRASGSTVVAAVSALVLVVAGPRGYAYPKLLVYAVTGWLWWWYVWAPGRGKALALGVCTAVAFYWRPDHGLHVAAGVTLALIAAHGLHAVTVIRSIQAGVVAILCTLPYLVYAAVQTGGVVPLVRDGLTATVEEHRGAHEYPSWPIRRRADVIAVDAPADYAPEIVIRWTHDSAETDRQQLLERYDLTVVSTEDPGSPRVRLATVTPDRVRALLAEPIVDDTNGLDRGAAAIPSSTWPALDRWRFRHWWLRVRVLPGLNDQPSAGDAAAILLFLLPLAGLGCALTPLRRYLPGHVAPAALACFCLFGTIVNVGLLRTPYHVRAADAAVLPAIVLGLLAVALWGVAVVHRGWRRWLPRVAVVVLMLLVTKSLAVAGQSGERVTWLAGGWTSLDRSREAWEETWGRLWSSPPIEYWRSRGPDLTLRLAGYARECVGPEDRILVRWFAPEIYYYSDRLMAGRHLFYLPAFSALPTQQRMEIEKIRRFAPRLVFDRASDRVADEAFPEVGALIASEYRVAAVDEAGGDQYRILVRVDDDPTRRYGSAQWPCFR